MMLKLYEQVIAKRKVAVTSLVCTVDFTVVTPCTELH